jgi:hypothetical protein
MGRILMMLMVVTFMAAMLGTTSGLAMADNSGEQKSPGTQGPPVTSGNFSGDPPTKTRVTHCNSDSIQQDLPGARGVTIDRNFVTYNPGNQCAPSS